MSKNALSLSLTVAVNTEGYRRLITEGYRRHEIEDRFGAKFQILTSNFSALKGFMGQF